MPDAKAHALVLERFQFMAITDALEPTWCYVESIDAKKSVSLTDIVSFFPTRNRRFKIDYQKFDFISFKAIKCKRATSMCTCVNK